MAVSSTSMKVGSITETVTSHGFTPWVSGYRAWAAAVVIERELS
jgi:hypothetical protein